MDTESQPRGRGQNQRHWTPEENKALIDTLVELSMDPLWQTKNGFRGGNLFQLEKMIKERILQTMLKAIPNIESHMKLLRTKTTAISDILRMSGFDWNYESSTIMCNKSGYDKYVKGRAFGSSVRDIGDYASQYEDEVNIIMEECAGLSQMPIDDFFMHKQEPLQEQIESPSPMPSDSSASKTSRRRKRKSYWRFNGGVNF
ncbi:putative Myb/SANT-like domain-containing protein [Dioscorea sansibarensis]